jgi:hypothetical protein
MLMLDQLPVFLVSLGMLTMNNDALLAPDRHEPQRPRVRKGTIRHASNLETALNRLLCCNPSAWLIKMKQVITGLSKVKVTTVAMDHAVIRNELEMVALANSPASYLLASF